MTVVSRAKIAPRPNHSVRRRAAYSLAAGAAGAAAATAANEAQAVIQYSGLQNISVAQFNSQEINLDLDAFQDIKLKNYVFGGGNYQGATVNFGPGQVVGFLGAFAYVSALSEGYPIRATTVGPTFYGSMAYGLNNPLAMFNNVTNAYIGLSFPAGGDLYYGWLRVDVNNAAGTLVIKDWAYQDNPGQGILAGAVPEPGTLGLLAAGAIGVSALRRKRRSSERA